MKEIKLFYWLDVQNFGDALNIDVCEKLFNIKAVKALPQDCEATFIGSTLDDFLFRGVKFFNKNYRKCYDLEPVKIWGSGFISPPNTFCKRYFHTSEQYFRKAEVYAVRGEKSQKRLKAIDGVDFKSTVLADPGLLASELCKKQPKKYQFGIIPHHVEEDLKIFQYLNENISNSIVIKMSWDVDTVLTLMQQCRYIISSAMHGLIVADSLGIPNMQLRVSNRLLGGMYKFEDYYSSFGIYERNILNEKTLKNMDVSKLDKFIEGNYKINPKEVDEKRNKLYKCFPF